MQIWGLGFLFVETLSQALGARTLNWFLTTPLDGETVEILVSEKVQALDGSGIKAIRLVPKSWRQRFQAVYRVSCSMTTRTRYLSQALA